MKKRLRLKIEWAEGFGLGFGISWAWNICLQGIFLFWMFELEFVSRPGEKGG